MNILYWVVVFNSKTGSVDYEDYQVADGSENARNLVAAKMGKAFTPDHAFYVVKIAT